MGEIDSGHIHTRLNHLLHNPGSIRSWPDGANDLCLVSWKFHHACLPLLKGLFMGLKSLPSLFGIGYGAK
jgi:hypothetical protein